jgi:glycosyltransferase involved in cell wall biosynthesis
MPKVSVIIPSYNHEKYVAQAIQSVLDQTYQDFEIIITDDGSTDGSVNEINKFTDPRIRLFVFDKNQGACTAVRKCLDEARGDYVTVLSSDDIFFPDKLEKQVSFLDEHTEMGAVFGLAHIIDEDGNDFADKSHFYYSIFKQPNRNRHEWLNYFFYKGNCLCHPSILIRKECYKTVGYYDERYAQLPDYDFWIRLCLKYEIFIIQENLIKFRVRKDELNVSGNRPEVKIRDAWEHGQILNNYLNINNIKDLLLIFPELSRYKGKIKKSLIPFFIALLALEVEGCNRKLFAINTLYYLLGQNRLIDKLRKIGFEYIDFIKLTGRHDIFNLVAIQQEKSELNNKTNKIEKLSAEITAKDSYLKALEQTLYRKRDNFKKTFSLDSKHTISMHIDLLIQHDRYIEIEGWAYITGKSSVNNKISVILKSDQNSYMFATTPVKRPDVTAHYNTLNFDDSGFSAFIPSILLDKGEYDVFIYIKKGAVKAMQFTENKVTIGE